MTGIRSNPARPDPWGPWEGNIPGLPEKTYTSVYPELSLYPGQLDWPRFLVVEEDDDVTSPFSNCRLDSTRRPTDLA
jgi:hypothetical protein